MMDKWWPAYQDVEVEAVINNFYYLILVNSRGADVLKVGQWPL